MTQFWKLAAQQARATHHAKRPSGNNIRATGNDTRESAALNAPGIRQVHQQVPRAAVVPVAIDVGQPWDNAGLQQLVRRHETAEPHGRECGAVVPLLVVVLPHVHAKRLEVAVLARLQLLHHLPVCRVVLLHAVVSEDLRARVRMCGRHHSEQVVRA